MIFDSRALHPFEDKRTAVFVFVLVRATRRSVLHGKERRRANDVSGCLPALSADEKEIAESLYALGDRDVHPDGGYRGFFAMVSCLHGAPFAISHGSCEKNGESGEAEPRKAHPKTAAGVVLLRMSAALRDRSMSKGRRVLSCQVLDNVL